MKNLAVSLNETMELIKGLTDLLSDKQKTELRRNITIQKYLKNEIIYNEGDVPTNLLCLISRAVSWLQGVFRQPELRHRGIGFRNLLRLQNSNGPRL